MSDHIERAADEIIGIQVGTGYESVTIGIDEAMEAARALDAAGLLVTSEHDAEQRRAGAVEALGEVRAALRAEVVIRDYEQSNVSRADLWALAGQFTPDWLDSLRADRIEREAGESGADT